MGKCFHTVNMLLWFPRCLRIRRIVRLSAGMGCLLLSLAALAQDLSGQDKGAGQTQADTATLPTVKTTVVVEETALDNARAQISPTLGATTYTLDTDQIDSQSQGEFGSFDQTFYRFPGVVQDELDKRLHVRGEEANLQYRINGLLLPDGLLGFGQELSTKVLDSVSLITGSVPAQYGNRTTGIVDLRTKSSEDLSGGTVSVYGGNYLTATPMVEYGENRAILGLRAGQLPAQRDWHGQSDRELPSGARRHESIQGLRQFVLSN